MSLHFRGPLRLKQLAVYLPDSQQKRDQTVEGFESDVENEAGAGNGQLKTGHHQRHSHHYVHGHGHRHSPQYKNHHDENGDRGAKVEQRTCPEQWVTATIDGKVVSWLNDWCPGASTAAPAPTPTPSALPATNPATPTSAPSPPSPPIGDSAGSGSRPSSPALRRSAYYNAAKQQANGLVFLGNYGDSQVSGRWTQ